MRTCILGPGWACERLRLPSLFQAVHLSICGDWSWRRRMARPCPAGSSTVLFFVFFLTLPNLLSNLRIAQSDHAVVQEVPFSASVFISVDCHPLAQTQTGLLRTLICLFGPRWHKFPSTHQPDPLSVHRFVCAASPWAFPSHHTWHTLYSVCACTQQYTCMVLHMQVIGHWLKRFSFDWCPRFVGVFFVCFVFLKHTSVGGFQFITFIYILRFSSRAPSNRNKRTTHTHKDTPAHLSEWWHKVHKAYNTSVGPPSGAGCVWFVSKWHQKPSVQRMRRLQWSAASPTFPCCSHLYQQHGRRTDEDSGIVTACRPPPLWLLGYALWLLKPNHTSYP